MKRIILMVLTILMLFAAFVGCADIAGVKTKNVSIPYPKAIAFDDYDSQYKVIEQNAVDKSILKGIREFSYNSGSVILGCEKKNVCYSPLSLYMALAMLSNGANGQTQDEILALLKESDAEFLSEQMGKLFRLMYRDNEMSTFLIANSLWINSNYGVKQEFADHTIENFYAAANEVDF